MTFRLLLDIAGRQHTPCPLHASPLDDEKIASALDALVGPGLITKTTRGYDRRLWVELTDLGQQCVDDTDWRLERDDLGDTPNSRSPGDRALTLWIIRFGGTINHIFQGDPEADVNLWHLAACGVDWARSGQVTDDVWVSTDSTFDEEGTTHRGLSADVTCRCGHVDRLHVQAEMDSYTDLLRSIL